MSRESPAQQLLEWLAACDKLHGDECQAKPMSARSGDQIPQWVIDTQQGCIVPGTKAGRYVALSYVWPEVGTNVERLMLERNNIEALQKPGVLSSDLVNRLPLVIRQTIELLQDIGERYLWVDCLCIVQHDGETQSQAYSMNEIYSGAYFTIIAAASEGLFGTEGTAVSHWEDYTSSESHYTTLMETKWATRGWTFQEQVLSKRSIIFMGLYWIDPHKGWILSALGSKFAAKLASESARARLETLKPDLFWDCQCALWDGNTLHPPREELQGHKPKTKALSLNDTAWPKFRSYLEAVCLYNNRDLTYPQDVGVALSGVLNELGHTFPGGFLHGIPQCFIDEVLLWQPFSKAVRRQSIINDTIAPHRDLPSWSWCSWKCPVDPFSLVTGLEYSLDKDELKRRPSWRTIPLIEWTMLSKDMSQEVSLTHAGLQAKCKQAVASGNLNNGNGWKRHASTGKPDDDPWFTHPSSGHRRVRFPLPIGFVSPLSMSHAALPYLACTTHCACFTIREILRCIDQDMMLAAIETSVFDLPQFKDGPAQHDACSVLTLEDPSGGWAGVVRVMDDEVTPPGQQVELIAISEGEVNYSDVVWSFDESIDFLQQFTYRKGTRTLLWERKSRASTTRAARAFGFRQTLKPEIAATRPNDLVEAFNRLLDLTFMALEGKYSFYNVMWIERRGEIAHRRGVGRIRKETWERYSGERVRVVLG